jgi:hypothetical protein
MTFDYEHQMVKPAEQWLSSQGLATKREFSTPWGICDLVGCSMKEESVRQRLALGQTKPIGPQIRVLILSCIPDKTEDKSIGLKRLCREFSGFLDEDRIALALDQLMKDKFVQTTRAGLFQKLNGWMPLHKRLVALELKLSRINDALHQAISNLEFADESYVGIPVEIGKSLINSRKKSEFVHEGIGIVGISQKRCKVLLNSNPTAKPHKNQIIQTHCVERFWRTRIKDN